MHRPRPSKFNQFLITTLCFLSAVYVAWLMLARYDFFYDTAYDLLDIGSTIQRYGPDNHVRPDFEHTSRSERERLFSEIARSVRNQGIGLDDIRYATSHQGRQRSLLTSAEIHHLKSVSELLARAEQFGKLALTGFSLMLVYLLASHRPSPRVLPALLYPLGLTTVLAIGIVLAGPQAIFYRWHEWAFPEGQQWFFYYEESLMTLLMKAPDLFGFIAIGWGILTITIHAVLLAAARFLTTRGDRVPPGQNSEAANPI